MHNGALLSGSMLRSYVYTSKRKSHSAWLKNEEKQDKNDSIWQGPCSGLLGCWSHDQCPKIAKMKVVALHCSFLNLFEICSKVLPLWRYEVKDCEKFRVFFCFLCFSPWKQDQIRWFQHIYKAKRRGYNYCIVGKMTKKECAYPKRECDTNRLHKITHWLQKSDTDYEVY